MKTVKLLYVIEAEVGPTAKDPYKTLRQKVNKFRNVVQPTAEHGLTIVEATSADVRELTTLTVADPSKASSLNAKVASKLGWLFAAAQAAPNRRDKRKRVR